MEIIPSAVVTRFEQLEPGDLFLYMQGEHKFYALKTQQPPNGDRSTMVTLGPSLLLNSSESFLLPWQAATVMSLGKNFSILLPTEVSAWSAMGPNRTPVCLAVAEETAFICTNGGAGPNQYFACFVDVKTGAIREARLQSAAIFTNSWQIAVLGANHPPRTILKFPLPEGG
jgi:hypothetical protein